MRTLSSLIGRHVVTTSGAELGRCHDIRAELTGHRLEVVALCVGAEGYRARLGIRSHGHQEIPWAWIIRIEGSQIVVNDPQRDAPV
jgi:sporulation protein YlmC with PRC-barrel domain